MPKLVLALGADAAKVEAVEGFANYSGPTPPAGLYFSRVKQIGITETKQTKKTMLRVVVEFKAKDNNDPRKKFNGYAIFWHLVIPDDATEEHYGLQVERGTRVIANGMPGRVLGGTHHVWVHRDGEKHPGPYHPADVSVSHV